METGQKEGHSRKACSDQGPRGSVLRGNCQISISIFTVDIHYTYSQLPKQLVSGRQLKRRDQTLEGLGWRTWRKGWHDQSKMLGPFLYWRKGQEARSSSPWKAAQVWSWRGETGVGGIISRTLVSNRQMRERCLRGFILDWSRLTYWQDTQLEVITGSWKLLHKILQLIAKCIQHFGAGGNWLDSCFGAPISGICMAKPGTTVMSGCVNWRRA